MTNILIVWKVEKSGKKGKENVYKRIVHADGCIYLYMYRSNFYHLIILNP